MQVCGRLLRMHVDMCVSDVCGMLDNLILDKLDRSVSPGGYRTPEKPYIDGHTEDTHLVNLLMLSSSLFMNGIVSISSSVFSLTRSISIGASN